MSMPLLVATRTGEADRGRFLDASISENSSVSSSTLKYRWDARGGAAAASVLQVSTPAGRKGR